MLIPEDQKKRKKLIERRHPEYEGLLNHWRFLEATYHGGRAWFGDHIFRYIKEGEREFSDRVSRAYRFNHTREVVDLVNKYVFKSEIIRNEDDATDAIKEFWKGATADGLSIEQFMKDVAKATSTFGRIWIVVDATRPVTGVEPMTKADEKRAAIRRYAYYIKPHNMLDLAYGDDGELLWTLTHETSRDDGNPFDSSGDVRSRFRLWARDFWVVFEKRKHKTGGTGFTVEIVEQGVNALGFVPMFPADHTISTERYTTEALINDIAYLDRASANYLSNLDAIIQDQTFSQLAMPAQNVLPGEDGADKLLEMGTKRIFLYDGEANTAPFYLSPDVKQAELIITVINKIIGEIYHSVGMAGERTKQDNAQGIDNSSGVAKAYDFERMNSLLAAKADSLDTIENKLIKLVQLYAGETPVKKDLVKYPDTFDVRGLYDEFDIATRLALIDAPETVRREQMKALIDKMFPRLADDLKAKMLKELDDWPHDLDETLRRGLAAPGKADTLSSGASKPLPGGQKKNRQGENTGKSDADAK